ncbi:MAG: hypothetical protein M3R15_23815 [Acidobacteriota bacterium]|nr:hypothetical protein [Acidobacteriota bacterium]
MSVGKAIIWGIHGGKAGDADTLFLNRKQIALGWHEIGDLSHIKPDREAFKTKIAETYPDKKPNAIPNNAGQLFRFIHEMKPGDLIAYPSTIDRHIHIRRIEGAYKYDPDFDKAIRIFALWCGFVACRGHTSRKGHSMKSALQSPSSKLRTTLTSTVPRLKAKHQP